MERFSSDAWMLTSSAEPMAPPGVGNARMLISVIFQQLCDARFKRV